jgi:CO/xanthine dehydrogenase Mo-binding subunit
VFEEYDMGQLKTVNSIATGGGAKTAWFKDTEGNTLAISQRRVTIDQAAAAADADTRLRAARRRSVARDRSPRSPVVAAAAASLLQPPASRRSGAAGARVRIARRLLALGAE